jgi:hypothetical protein
MRRPVALLAAAAAVATLALVETTLALTAQARVARADEWEAAAVAVRALFRPGDLIVFAPAWVDQIGRAHLGDLMPPEMVGRADDDRYRRVFEVSVRGAAAGVGGRVVSDERHGRVRVRLFEAPHPAEVLTDFTARAEEARVTQRAGGAADESPCYSDGPAAYRCAQTRVERRTLEVDYRPRRGLLVPVDGARTTAVTFDGAALGTTLVGYTGLSDYFSRKNADGPVTFRVLVDGAEALRVTHGNADGWRRFALPTSPGAHQVRFEVSAPEPAWRTFGFHAEARR